MVFCVITVTSFGAVTPPDSSTSIVEKGKVQVWLQDGRNSQLLRDWRGARATFKQVLQVDPGNAIAHYRIAECDYELKFYEYALKYLKDAKNLKPDVHKDYDYLLGKIHYRIGNLDKAIEAFQRFKMSTSERKIEEYLIDKYIKNAEYAKKMIKDSMDVFIEPIGGDINSRYREYLPVPSPDGSKIYFTSRRQSSDQGELAVDHVYYEDIFYVEWDSTKGTWSDVESVPGKVNTDEFNSISYITPDGEYMYVTVNVGGWTQSTDIAYSKLSRSGKWGTPKLLDKRKGNKGGINTSFHEASPVLTEGGNVMYFSGEGLKGEGRTDIYRVEKKGRGWGVPKNLGPTINTADDENNVWVHPSGKLMFFSSNGHPSIGGYDIYYSEWKDSVWTEPKNMGYPLNGLDDDSHFKLSTDGKTGYYASVRKEGEGWHDIYVIDMTTHPVYELIEKYQDQIPPWDD